jgi:hypothetical protein
MGVTSATILPAIMQPLLPEKESRNGTGAKMLAQAKYRVRMRSDATKHRSTPSSGQSTVLRAVKTAERRNENATS